MNQDYDHPEGEVFYQNSFDEEPLNPCFSIWTKPRATMRQIFETDPERLVLVLAMAGGFGESLGQASMENLGDHTPLAGIIAFALIGGAIGGSIGLYLGGAMLCWTGRWLGGTGTPVTVRAAIAWGQVPAIWALLLWVPFFALYGAEMFSEVKPLMNANPFPVVGLSVIELVIVIWGIVVGLKCLGEAHEFSAWRALGAGLLFGLLILGIVIAIALPFILFAVLS